MSSSRYLCDAELIERVKGAGAYAAAVIPIKPVDPSASESYRRWIADGAHGTMDYLERYPDIRDNPALLLPGARSMVIAAFNYYIPYRRPPGALRIARYALVDDYHHTLRKALKPVTRWIADTVGAKSRICVDSAPIRERYWASRAGLGFIGRNNHLIIPQAGSYFFLATIITTAPVSPGAEPPLTDTPARPMPHPCDGCVRCVQACPGGALSADAPIDARRCHSYLTIEHKYTTPPSSPIPVGSGSAPGDRGLPFYGCDVCQDTCPHNSPLLSGQLTLPSIFSIRQEIASLTRDDVEPMTTEEYEELFARSAMRRVTLDRMKRNLHHTIDSDQSSSTP